MCSGFSFHKGKGHFDLCIKKKKRIEIGLACGLCKSSLFFSAFNSKISMLVDLSLSFYKRMLLFGQE